MDLESLYSCLPNSLQHLAVTLESWRIKRLRYSGSFESLLAAYHARGCWARELVLAYRDQQVRKFLQHASCTVPYYRELFGKVGLTPEDIQGFDDLKRLPVLTKQHVQEHPAYFASEVVPESACTTSHTSGTTGTGLRFRVTVDAHREQWAVWWRYRGWHGIARDTRCCYFGGRSIVPLSQRRPPFWRYDWAGHQVLFSAYHLSRKTAAAYVREVRRSGAPWIHGYPSVVSVLAAFAIELGMSFPDIRWVTTGAESLLPQQVEVIKRAFGVRAIEHYGMAEAAANISMCPAGRLHVDEDFAAVEFLPNPLGGYRIVGTNFTNPATPLIRYEIGDIAELAPEGEQCECGFPGRVVRSVDGRKEDLVVAKNGAILGRLDHIFKDQVHIREAQIRQDRAGHMAILIVKGPKYSQQHEAALEREVQTRVGNEMDFEIRYVQSIERTATGKLRFVVSSVRTSDRPHEASLVSGGL